MNVLIAEDEILAAERLQELLLKYDSSITVTDHVDSVEDLIHFFNSGKTVDLLLLDIQLADGKSFEAFDKVKIETPIIFTTAFDQYAIQAFKHFSIDYLLKPIQAEALATALDKYKRIKQTANFQATDIQAIKKLLTERKPYKERFVIKSGNKLYYKPTNEVAYFYADGKLAYLVTKKENRKYIIDNTLEDLEAVLDPAMFFRISRKFIISVDSIAEVKGLISTRLEIKLNQPSEHELSVSRERAHAFKNWLDR